MECTIRNFIEGCIIDAHPMAVLFGGLGVLFVLLMVGVMIYAAYHEGKNIRGD